MSRAKFKLVHTVPIDKILLDTANPRIRTGATQQDCIDKVLRKQSQMLVLMKSIAEDGLGTMPLLLYRAPRKKAEWIVKDGNRRITALKLLNNPSLCSDPALRAQIENIREKHKQNIPQSVDCLESSDLNLIAREVLSRHGGALDGAGQLDWDAYLRTVFQLTTGLPASYKRAGQYLFWAEKNGISVDDEFPITSVTRFLNEANLKLLGFDVENEELVPNTNPVLVLRMTTKVVTDFGINRKSVNEVYNADQAAAYIQEVRNASGVQVELDAADDAPATVGRPDEQHENQPGPGAPTVGGDDGSTTTPSGPRIGRPPSKPAWDRKKIFWRASPAPSVPIAEKKAKLILFELGRIPNTQEMSLTCAMLLRALIELSVSSYQRKHSMRDHNKLAKNMESVADSLLTNGAIDQSLADLVKAYAKTDRDQVSIFNIDTIQKYIHRDTHIPTHVTLHTVWDEIGLFVRACWSNQ